MNHFAIIATAVALVACVLSSLVAVDAKPMLERLQYVKRDHHGHSHPTKRYAPHSHDDSMHQDADYTHNQGYGPAKEINFSGYIGVPDDEGNANERQMFYWFFESRASPSTDPLVVWLTGGPGCSSMMALLVENGPYHLAPESHTKLVSNPYSWNSHANVIWVDQPVGTGFSYNKKGLDPGVTSEKDVASNLYDFLQVFLKQNTQYQSHKFYITGESYAGHYVPAFAAYTHRQNINIKSGNIHVNLAGIAIGNGLVAPYDQYHEYAPYAEAMGVVTSGEAEWMQKGIKPCVDEIKKCETGEHNRLTCVESLGICNLSELIPFEFTGRNVYDVRIPCKIPPLCYDFSNVTLFFNDAEVKKALGVPHRLKWESCNRGAALGLTFGGDWMLNFANDIPELLAHNITALVYSGEDDFICNWYGGQRWTHNMKWPGQDKFRTSRNETWMVDGEMAGSFVGVDGFTFLRVKDAGHMVPMNQPQHALDMIQKMFERKWR